MMFLKLIVTLLFVGLNLYGLDAHAGGASSRIVGGDAADPYSIPWQVAIKRKKTFGDEYNLLCGGIVISESWILTATDCELDLSKDIVVAGEFSFSIVEESEQIRDILRYEIHPEFGVFGYYDMDFQLIELLEPLDFSSGKIASAIRPDPNEDFSTGYGIVSGWGSTNDGGAHTDLLRMVRVPIVDQFTCNLNFDGDVSENMICAGEEGKDWCGGDLGGPLMYENVTGPLIGLVSWSYDCGREEYPGVYSRITSGLSWIDETCGNCWI